MDCPEERSVAALPDDPLVEILSRVSFKGLNRSKCVSKAWCDLITDPFHRKKLPKTLEGFFYGGGGGNYGRYIDLMNRSESEPLVDPSFSFLTKLLPGIEYLRLVHPCNGLLLFVFWHDCDTFGYVVCNPTTEQLVVVPASPIKESDGFTCPEYHIFLIFDPAVSSHFHLIQFWWSKFHRGVSVTAVHTFSSATGVWSDSASEGRAGEEGGGWRQWGESESIWRLNHSVVFNNMLHFIVVHMGEEVPRIPYKIVAVGVEGKTCRVIPWRENFGQPTFVGQSQGRLFCLTVGVGQVAELSIWVLEEYDTEEWSLKHRVSFLKLFGKMISDGYDSYIVVAIHPDRNLIFFLDLCDKRLISYDMDSGEAHALCTLGRGEFTPYVPYFSELPVLTNKN